MEPEEVDETLDFIIDTVQLMLEGKGGLHAIANIAGAVSRLRVAFGARQEGGIRDA